MNKNSKKKKNDKNGTKLPFVYIREEVDGQVSPYDMNIFSKIKNVLKYMDEASGRAFKREQVKRRKEMERISSLQITCTNFLDKIYDSITGNRSKNIMSRRVVAQLDPKFNQVLKETLSAESHRIEVKIRPINKNYQKYTNKIPTQIEVKCKDSINL